MRTQRGGLVSKAKRPRNNTRAPRSIASGKINGSEAAAFLRPVGHVLYTSANLNLNSRTDGFREAYHDTIRLLKLTAELRVYSFTLVRFKSLSTKPSSNREISSNISHVSSWNG